MQEDKGQCTWVDITAEGEKESGVTVAGVRHDPILLWKSWSRRQRVLGLLGIGFLVLAYPLWNVVTKNWPHARETTPLGAQSASGNLEATPEVANTMKGEWIEVSGWWSKYGVMGAAFDGEEIVINSGESDHGGLGCWVSLDARPLRGKCHESSRSAGSKLGSGRVCSWQLVIQEISQTRIRGARVFKEDGSDPGCKEDYGSLPSSFTWEKPGGPRAW
jgi:hypothetical protein